MPLQWLDKGGEGADMDGRGLEGERRGGGVVEKAQGEVSGHSCSASCDLSNRLVSGCCMAYCLLQVGEKRGEGRGGDPNPITMEHPAQQ